jgi:hypothetical protein
MLYGFDPAEQGPILRCLVNSLISTLATLALRFLRTFLSSSYFTMSSMQLRRFGLAIIFFSAVLYLAFYYLETLRAPPQQIP